MFGLRPKFAFNRFFSPSYYRKLSKVVESPSQFYFLLALKLAPGLHTTPVNLRLKDGKIAQIKEFWALYVFDEIFIQRCYDAPALLKRTHTRTVIDVGANIGWFSLRAKQLWPDARIIAIEPVPTNFQALQENIALSGLKDVTPLQIGLSDSCGCFDLYLSPRNIGGHSLYKKTGTSVKIKTRTLADVFAMLGSEQTCDVLKIDCEGCEYPLLSSLTPEVAKRIGCVIFEPERGLYDLEAFKVKLNWLGFDVTPFGDLMVCTRAAAA